MTTQFDYDVALSFHSEGVDGAATVYQLNDLLRGRFADVPLLEEAGWLAGTDGEVSFNAVFEKQARVVVVFYRGESG